MAEIELSILLEYRRNVSINLFAYLQPLVGWRHIEFTEGRTNIDFAKQMKDLVDV